MLISLCWTDKEINNEVNVSNNELNSIVSIENRNEEIISLQPDYKSELYWKIKQIEWNIFDISEIDISKDTTIDMDSEEKKDLEAKKNQYSSFDIKLSEEQLQNYDFKILILSCNKTSKLDPIDALRN